MCALIAPRFHGDSVNECFHTWRHESTYGLFYVTMKTFELYSLYVFQIPQTLSLSGLSFDTRA